MKLALAILCGLTMLATACLTVSLLVLQPPHANYQQWSVVAALIVTQGALTLAVLAGALGPAARPVVLAGGAAVGLFGAWWAYSTLASPHFEGYALVLGAMLVVQGALTLGGRCQTPYKS